MGKIKVNCEMCNKEMEKYKSAYNNSKTKKFYCSKECRSKYRASKVETQNFVCKYCNQEFTRTSREVRLITRQGSEVTYCSKECKAARRAVKHKIVQCTECQKDIERRVTDICETNFCNKECQKEYHKKNNMITLKCKECGGDFQHKTHYILRQAERGQEVKYCSRKCHMINFSSNKNYVDSGVKHEYSKVLCKNCDNEFYQNHSHKIYCSNMCRLEYAKKQRVDVICNYCKKSFKKSPGRINKTNYCNVKCFNEYRKIEKKKYEQIAHYLRSSTEYSNWRKSVFERDEYKCKECGDAKSRLHAHHVTTLHEIAHMYPTQEEVIKSFEFNDINNGITLCETCHNKQHPFLKRDNKGRFCRITPRLQKE